jgi:hypothetical protein
MNLNDIATRINSIVKSINDKNPSETPKVVVATKKTKTDEKGSNRSRTLTQSISADKKSEIIQYLQGNELKREVLVNYRNEADATLKKSIDLCFSFWSLVKDSNQMDEFVNFLKEKIKEDENLKTSNLKDFLVKICENSNSFKKYNELPGKGLINTLEELKRKVQI